MADDWQDALASAIAAAADGALITKWIVVAELITDEGETQLERFTSPGSSQWDRLGMLEHSAECERMHLRDDD